MKDNYDIIIIVAGMGGLTSAAWLTHIGMKVLVIEQNIQPGGCCSSYKRGDYNFTPAAAIITGATKKNGLFERMLKTLGIEIDFIPLDQGYHIHLPDFDYYLYSGGEHARDQLVEELIRLFPHEASGIKKFFKVLVKINDQMDYATFLGTGPKDLARILFKCPTLAKNAGKGILPFADSFVTDPKLKSVLSINSTCCNLPPSRMSLLGIVGLLVEGGLSNPHVVGGSQAVPDAFVKYLREQGSDVVMGTMADQILLEGKTAGGVRVKPSSIAAEKDYKKGILEPKEIKAKYVISNAAARQTFDELVGRKNLPAKFINNLERMEPTPTFCALFLGLNLDLKNMGFTPALHVHSSTYNIDEHFRNIDSKIANETAADTFFRFQLAPLSDPTSAPEGKTAFVMHVIPAPVSGWNAPDFEKRVADVMVKRAENVIPGLSKHIEYQEFCSPVTLDKYLMCGRDASLGWALTPQQVGSKRLSPKTPIKNLFLSGHWTGPAVGVASAVISGLKTASMILKEEGVKEPLSNVGVIDSVVKG